MYGMEKVLNEATFILAVGTIISTFLYKNGKISLGFLIFLCCLTVLIYFCSKSVNDNNSKLNEKDNEVLKDLKKDMNNKKGNK